MPIQIIAPPETVDLKNDLDGTGFSSPAHGLQTRRKMKNKKAELTREKI